MSSISSGSASVGQSILSAQRKLIARPAPQGAAPALVRDDAGRFSINAEGGNLRSLYGQLAQKFMSNRKGDDETAQAKAAAAALTAAKAGTTTSTNATKGADTVTYSTRTLSTSYVRPSTTSRVGPTSANTAGPAVEAPDVEEEPAPTEPVTIDISDSSAIDLDEGVIKLADRLTTGTTYTVRNDTSSATFSTYVDGEGTTRVRGTIVRDTTTGEIAEFDSVYDDENAVRFAQALTEPVATAAPTQTVEQRAAELITSEDVLDAGSLNMTRATVAEILANGGTVTRAGRGEFEFSMDGLSGSIKGNGASTRMMLNFSGYGGATGSAEMRITGNNNYQIRNSSNLGTTMAATTFANNVKTRSSDPNLVGSLVNVLI
jgi:hypothetical protein